MNYRDHAVILDGYLSRLTISQRDRIIEADNKVIHAQLNLGLSSQLKAQNDKLNLIEQIMGEMVSGDLANMESIITRIVKEEGDLKPGVL